MIEKLIILLSQSPMIKLVMLCVIADTILGCLRAIKYRKFNSSVGIDGAIRKVAMLACVVVLMVADVLININLITMIPGDYTSILGIKKIGLCEFFSLLFIAYECISVLKNMLLCGLPVPKKLKELAGRISGKYDSRTSGGNRRSGTAETAETAETEQRQSPVIINY